MAQSSQRFEPPQNPGRFRKLDEAQKLITRVLITHPGSAKAHFVQSELFARQGNLSKGREALASAEKLAPGLPFAKAEAVQALRSQLASRSAPLAAREAPVSNLASAPSGSTSAPWVLPVVLTGSVMLAGYFFFRRKSPAQSLPQAAPAYQNGLNGPQTFGIPTPPQPAAAQPATGQPAAAPPAAAPPASSGLGGQIMGGVATGLAVGAGVMAAQAIGRNLMGNHSQSAPQAENRLTTDYPASSTNTDMGGQDFGINDNASWEDGGSAGDWDT